MNSLLKKSSKNSIKIAAFDLNRGFSMVEVTVVILIFSILAALSFATYVSFSDYQSIDKDADVVVSLVQQARNQTINSKNNSSYGIKFASSSVTLFTGRGYATTSPANSVYNLSSKVKLSSISLTGGTTTIYFMPITGKPSATGTISLVLKTGNGTSTNKTLLLYGSGLVEIQ